jgi:hypothetical protein
MTSGVTSIPDWSGLAARDDLFTQDVGVASVLIELAGDLELQRPDGTLATPIDEVLARSSCEVRPELAGQSRNSACTLAIVSCLSSVNEPSTVAAMLLSAYDRPVTAWSNHTPSTKRACLTRPSSVVADDTTSEAPLAASSRSVES